MESSIQPSAAIPPAAPAHLAYADHLRIGAAIAVIAVHTAGLRVSHLPDVDSTAWLVANAIDSSGRWAAGIFLMLSGALLLPAHEQGPAAFYRKRLLRIGIPLLVWPALYFWWVWWWQGQHVDASIIAAAWWGGLFNNHLYYLVIIVALYLVTPALRVALHRLPEWSLWAATGAWLALSSSDAIHRALPMNALTLFIPYVPFFVLGGLLRRHAWSGRWVPFAVFALATAWIALNTYWSAAAYGRSDPRTFAMYSPFNPFVIAQTIAAWLFFRGIAAPAHAGLARAERAIAGATFGIYLVHMIWLDIVRGWTYAVDVAWTPALIPVEVALVFAFSAVVSLVLLRLPVVRLTIGS